MGQKQNCWEFFNCGREIGAAKADEMGICPAAADIASDGLNGGKNGGRICWSIAGTLCEGKVQGTFAQKQRACLKCDFLKKVRDEEKEKFSLLRLWQTYKGYLFKMLLWPFLIILASASLISAGIAASEASWHVKAAVMLTVLGAGVLAVRRIINNISQSLIRVAEYAKQVANHNWDAKPDLNLKGEVWFIVDAIQLISENMQKIFERSEQTVMELALQEEEIADMYARMTVIVDNIADGLLVTDINGRITRTNPSFSRMFGLKDEEIIGRECCEVCGNDVAGMIEAMKERPDKIITAEVALPGGIAKATAKAIYELSAASDGEEPQCIGSVFIFRDITQEKEIDRMKTDFISTVSHELRTPLTSILGFMKIIKKRLNEAVFPVIPGDEQKAQKAVDVVKDNIDIIVSEGERLTKLINDILDIAKMEAGKIEWKEEIISIPEIIDRAVTATKVLFEQKRLELIKDLEEGLPQVSGDKDRFIQVMINLISNAVKFTDNGTVTIKARKVHDEFDAVEISVVDTGIGIAKEDCDNIFEKFRQVGDTLTDRPIGTGLGLPICKQIIEHHGGRLWVESEPGKGSTFSFTIPVGKKEAVLSNITDMNALMGRLREHVTTTVPSDEYRGKTILVVDDDANIRKLLKQDFEAEGYRVREASNGIEAINYLKLERADLIIMDVMMPGMNGFDAAAIIRNTPLTRDIPIIILSIVEDADRGYRLGVDRYFTKPVNMEEILKETGLLISQGVSKKKIMVVDENESVAGTLTKVLESRGFDVVSVCNGSECIQKAVTEKPDMIIIDTVLSGKYNVARTLRFEKGLENVYFVFVSGDEDIEWLFPSTRQ